MDPRLELEQLRKVKRLRELEAKAGVSHAEEPSVVASKNTPAGQTALESYADTATLGYLPQAQAIASKVMYPVLNAVTGNNVQPDSYLQERDANRSRIEAQEKANPKEAIAGKVAGFGANLLVPGGLPGAIAQSAVANPGDVKGEYSGLQLEDRAKNAGLAALLGTGTELAGHGLTKGADYLMQKAANIKRMRPGAGTELIDSGVFGTRGMMQNQIAKKIPQAADELGAVVASVKDPIQISDTISALRQKAESYKLNGVVPDNAKGLYSHYNQLADDLQQIAGPTSEISAPVLSKFKQIQGDVAHTSAGAGGASDASVAALDAMRGSRSKLSSAIGEPYEAANSKLSALIRGKQGLEKSTSLSDLAQAATLAGLGYQIDGTEGALGGMALKSSLARSGGAHLSNALGKLATKGAVPVSKAYSLFGTREK